MLRLPMAMLAPVLAATGSAAALHAQSRQGLPSSASRTQASQIEPVARAPGDGPGKAYLDVKRSPPERQLPTASDQISHGDSRAPASQIARRAEGGSGMAQLSRADLDATLAQLSPVERRVLLQAIEGSDICDNPPAVPAIIALCQGRLENRSQEFAALAERPFNAEERLLRGDLENGAAPSLGEVIDRLGRASAATDDFSNQAIASVALSGSGLMVPQPDETPSQNPAFGEETQALINALITQLGGRAP